MIVLNFDELNLHRKTVTKDLKQSLFVYPTDTIYGIGCDATSETLIKQIRSIKKSAQPFSIIVPNKEWIYQNCLVTQEAEEWIRKLPGPYTLILKLKNPKAVAKNAYSTMIHDIPTIGVRMPNHWILSLVYDLRSPIVSTSANISGQDFMTTLDDLDPAIRTAVDYVFYEGPKNGAPSTIIDLTGNEVHLMTRTERHSPEESKIQFPIEEISLSRRI